MDTQQFGPSPQGGSNSPQPGKKKTDWGTIGAILVLLLVTTALAIASKHHAWWPFTKEAPPVVVEAPPAPPPPAPAPPPPPPPEPVVEAPPAPKKHWHKRVRKSDDENADDQDLASDDTATSTDTADTDKNVPLGTVSKQAEDGSSCIIEGITNPTKEQCAGYNASREELGRAELLAQKCAGEYGFNKVEDETPPTLVNVDDVPGDVTKVLDEKVR